MAKRFEELIVWQESRKLANVVYSLTKAEEFKREWDLVSQMRRAAISITSNVAEGFERGGNQEFIQFLFIAKGSCAELRSQIYVAFDQRLITQKAFESLLDHTRRVSSLLHTTIQSLRKSSMKGFKYSPISGSF